MSDIEKLQAEHDRFREHSVMLNRVAWRLAELMGDVGPDDTTHVGDADVLARLNAYAATK